MAHSRQYDNEEQCLEAGNGRIPHHFPRGRGSPQEQLHEARLDRDACDRASVDNVGHVVVQRVLTCYARYKQEFLSEFMDLRGGSPGHGAFSDVFNGLDPEQLSTAITNFAKTLVADAMHSQSETSSRIKEKGGDCVLSAKGSQGVHPILFGPTGCRWSKAEANAELAANAA